MLTHTGDSRSHLFTVRVWPEELDDGRMEWRGRIQYAANGETVYFRDWEAMLAFLLDSLGSSPAKKAHQEAQQDKHST